MIGRDHILPHRSIRSLNKLYRRRFSVLSPDVQSFERTILYSAISHIPRGGGKEKNSSRVHTTKLGIADQPVELISSEYKLKTACHSCCNTTQKLQQRRTPRNLAHAMIQQPKYVSQRILSTLFLAIRILPSTLSTSSSNSPSIAFCSTISSLMATPICLMRCTTVVKSTRS